MFNTILGLADEIGGQEKGGAKNNIPEEQAPTQEPEKRKRCAAGQQKDNKAHQCSEREHRNDESNRLRGERRGPGNTPN